MTFSGCFRTRRPPALFVNMLLWGQQCVGLSSNSPATSADADFLLKLQNPRQKRLLLHTASACLPMSRALGIVLPMNASRVDRRVSVQCRQRGRMAAENFTLNVLQRSRDYDGGRLVDEGSIPLL